MHNFLGLPLERTCPEVFDEREVAAARRSAANLPARAPVAPSGASVMGGMPLLRESARINRDKEGLRKQRPHATVASPPSVRPRDVRRLLELLLHLAAIGGALQRQSIAKGLERADERQCPG